MLTDNFGRFHNYLRISITEHCNLRCTYCMPAEGIKLTPKNHIMTADEIVQIAQTFVDLGIKKIRLTGGEPLLRKDAKKIIEQLSKLNIELAITTNGILVDQYIETFKKASIQSVNISLDSLKQDKFSFITRRDQFEKVLKNIHLLIENDFHVKLNVVLIKGFNDNEILDFIHLTKNTKIEIRFIEFMPFDGNKWNKDKLVSYNEILEEINTYYTPTNVIKKEDKPNDTAKNYKIANFKGSFAIISTVTNPFCDHCNRIRLTADGKLKNCLFSKLETSLLDTLRAGHSIIPLLKNNILLKEKTRAGFDTNESFTDSLNFNLNRSMITIGG
ncbi:MULTISPECIES: GTP 3',8-cyclase MoaA [Flavobacterium]|uniref:GTP 3',8-cyclase MoaA n=1 Tax=Flavobacterium TaxID=237 RepID=UPI000745C628|nr:GTP 3',8-cyclase MoaA [Flavobacterium covae]AMA49040.1 cyclic pyranopterin phosphate synthase MoaA [Flavobacterium covae]MCJ1806954.1 GTP 3',8-cyclase MoaA [Flavobacterium covae]MCJ1809762.1 GTP 3',8-cyclase MoaA [Flavobacterium covae]OXA76222.1 cyclic pyranopterin phosphate synthase MoaA [Flavobacterium columnare NBRC 100251 = ATCC 23463]